MAYFTESCANALKLGDVLLLDDIEYLIFSKYKYSMNITFKCKNMTDDSVIKKVHYTGDKVQSCDGTLYNASKIDELKNEVKHLKQILLDNKINKV